MSFPLFILDMRHYCLTLFHFPICVKLPNSKIIYQYAICNTNIFHWSKLSIKYFFLSRKWTSATCHFQIQTLVSLFIHIFFHLKDSMVVVVVFCCCCCCIVKEGYTKYQYLYHTLLMFCIYAKHTNLSLFIYEVNSSKLVTLGSQ